MRNLIIFDTLFDGGDPLERVRHVTILYDKPTKEIFKGYDDYCNKIIDAAEKRGDYSMDLDIETFPDWMVKHGFARETPIGERTEVFEQDVDL